MKIKYPSVARFHEFQLLAEKKDQQKREHRKLERANKAKGRKDKKKHG